MTLQIADVRNRRSGGVVARYANPLGPRPSGALPCRHYALYVSWGSWLIIVLIFSTGDRETRLWKANGIFEACKTVKDRFA
jgi:hypothetical protein